MQLIHENASFFEKLTNYIFDPSSLISVFVIFAILAALIGLSTYIFLGVFSFIASIILYIGTCFIVVLIPSAPNAFIDLGHYESEVIVQDIEGDRLTLILEDSYFTPVIYVKVDSKENIKDVKPDDTIKLKTERGHITQRSPDVIIPTRSYRSEYAFGPDKKDVERTQKYLTIDDKRVDIESVSQPSKDSVDLDAKYIEQGQTELIEIDTLKRRTDSITIKTTDNQTVTFESSHTRDIELLDTARTGGTIQYTEYQDRYDETKYIITEYTDKK